MSAIKRFAPVALFFCLAAAFVASGPRPFGATPETAGAGDG